MKRMNEYLSGQATEWVSLYETKGELPPQDALVEALAEAAKMDEANAEGWQGLLLYLLALKRAQKNKQDSLYYLLLEQAGALSPNRPDIQRRLETKSLNQMKGLLDGLTMPTLRETDNRTAKRNVVMEIIEKAERYERKLEETMNGLPIHEKSDSVGQVRGLLEAVAEQLLHVREQAQAYLETLSGSFHTVTVYEELKRAIVTMNEKRDQFDAFYGSLQVYTNEELSPLEELERMVGLKEVKQRASQLYDFLTYQKSRLEMGFAKSDDMSLNMILTGNPGTGKTTLARLLAKIYYELGILPKESIVEADRSKLVGAYVGQTEENVRKLVEEAVGGVLFIDEAYSLKREGQQGSDYGQTVIDTLVSLMDSAEYSGKFACVLAGYPDEMRQFLDSNPGLRSRFPQFNFMELSDYSMEEMKEIACQFAEDNGYFIAPDAYPALEKKIDHEMVDQSFGNARTVKSIVMDAIFHKGSRLNKNNKQTFLDFLLLQFEDFHESDVNTEPDEPFVELMNLVGLDSIKDEIKKLSAFVRVQQERRNAGKKVVPIQLHAVFTGNPGTGKTTVAKLYSEILRDCGLLKRGHLIVASRADFVAGYVGQTAIKTKRKIQDALGGVLFIDEAYSLLSQSNSDFGAEVVNTLVDEMTKHNENLVVILAGYPKEMDELLASNPGFSSRFKKFMHFPDYSVQELLQIMKNYMHAYQYRLDEEAEDYLLERLEQIEMDGNGRFAINLVDNAIQYQAQRLMMTDRESDNEESSSVLVRSDFEHVLE